MNRTDAATVLNIDPSASPEEARRAYQELFTEHQVRLTNAPTPALRSLYQARLLELDEARDVLLAQSAGDADSDLPTDQPSIPSPSREPLRPTASTPPPPEPPRRVQPQSQPVVETRAAEHKQEAPAAPKKKRDSLGRVGAFAWVLGILLVGGIFVALGVRRANNPVPNGTSPAPKAADSTSALKQSVTIAGVEFNRGDYDAANSALQDADRLYGALDSSAAVSDTTLIRLSKEMKQYHSKVVRACNALSKVAQSHPGEPTCKSL